MKRAEREVYRQLANEIETDLCSFCRYMWGVGGESPCDCGEGSCHHALGDMLENQWGGGSYGISPGDDCWGFRPSHSVSFCADIVGACLTNNWGEWVVFKSKHGVWRIIGHDVLAARIAEEVGK